MEFILILVSLFIIFVLEYVHTRIINLNKNNIYNESKIMQNLYKKRGKLNIETELLVTMFEFLIAAITSEIFIIVFGEAILRIFNGSLTFITIKYLSILIITILATYVTMIIGTYIPKHIVHTRKKHKFNDDFLVCIYTAITYIFYPITILSTYLDTKVREKVDDANNDLEEVRDFTNIGLEKGSITKIEKEIMENTVSSLDAPVYKICTKIDKVVSMNVTDNIDSVIRKFAKNGISRMLIYDKAKLLGYIHLKDILLNETSLKNGTKDITKFIKEPLKLKKEDIIQTSLIKMRNEKAKFAIVVNENDGIEGIVAIGDIVEELIGKQVEN